MYTYKRKGKQQAILLLLLFLLGMSSEIGAQIKGSGTLNDPYTGDWGENKELMLESGTYHLKDVKSGYIYIQGTVTLILRGTNILGGGDIGSPIRVTRGNALTLKSYGEEYTTLSVVGCEDSAKDLFAGIGGIISAEGPSDMGTLTISGSIYVNAKGIHVDKDRAPGIGGLRSPKKDITTGGGKLILEKGACLYLDDINTATATATATAQLPEITINDYAVIKTSLDQISIPGTKRIIDYSRLQSGKPSGWTAFTMGNFDGKVYSLKSAPNLEKLQIVVLATQGLLLLLICSFFSCFLRDWSYLPLSPDRRMRK